MLIIGNRKTRAVANTSQPQLDKPVRWEEIQREIKSLVGMQAAKHQLLEIAQALKNIREHQERHHIKTMPPLHFLIQGPAGGGKKHIALILSKLLQYYKLAEKPLLVITPNNIESLPEAAPECPVYVPVVERLIPREDRRNYLMASLLWAHLEMLAEQQTVILGIDSKAGEEFLETIDFASEIQLKIHIPQYDWTDFLAYARRYAARRKFKLTAAAVDEFRLRFEEQQEEPDFANMRTVQKLIDRAVMNYYMNPGQDNSVGRRYAALQREHFQTRSTVQIVPAIQLRTSDPLAQLNALVGLREVKARVNQLMALVNLQKKRREQGLPAEPITTHMAFSGPPGTGKTTVARLVGQALKELGVLEKGHLVEAGREDLVGQYVGHTAQKTAELVERALGGVLFIDECYSLNGGHNSDFGREAVAVLIKKMEDARDNLTVILSGYRREMEALFEINPGLRSRIQFHIAFPDYTAAELMQIFLKLCRDEHYELTREAARELERLLHSLHANRQQNFANGRLVRSLFERAKLALAARVWAEPEKTSVSLLLPEDIKALASYDDVVRMLQVPRRIGFQAVSA